MGELTRIGDYLRAHPELFPEPLGTKAAEAEGEGRQVPEDGSTAAAKRD